MSGPFGSAPQGGSGTNPQLDVSGAPIWAFVAGGGTLFPDIETEHVEPSPSGGPTSHEQDMARIRKYRLQIHLRIQVFEPTLVKGDTPREINRGKLQTDVAKADAEFSQLMHYAIDMLASGEGPTRRAWIGIRLLLSDRNGREKVVLKNKEAAESIQARLDICEMLNDCEYRFGKMKLLNERFLVKEDIIYHANYCYLFQMDGSLNYSKEWKGKANKHQITGKETLKEIVTKFTEIAAVRGTEEALLLRTQLMPVLRTPYGEENLTNSYNDISGGGKSQTVAFEVGMHMARFINTIEDELRIPPEEREVVKEMLRAQQDKEHMNKIAAAIDKQWAPSFGGGGARSQQAIAHDDQLFTQMIAQSMGLSISDPKTDAADNDKKRKKSALDSAVPKPLGLMPSGSSSSTRGGNFTQGVTTDRGSNNARCEHCGGLKKQSTSTTRGGDPSRGPTGARGARGARGTRGSST